MTSHKLWLVHALLGVLMLTAPARLLATPTPTDAQATPSGAASIDVIRLAQAAQPTPAPAPTAPAANPPAAAPATNAPAPTDSSTPTASSEPIGNVATLTGIATVIRNKNSLALHMRDDIFLNDQVQTSSSSSLGITFNDGTTFKLSANAKMTIDNYIYEDGGKQNAGIFDIGRGTVAFVAAAVAKTGDMKITTPTSTLGIRGTTGLVEVPQAGAAAGGNGENIKLYPDADGHVGRIEVSDHTGQRLGALTQGASGFTVHPGVGGARPTAQPLAISPREVARDQGLVREVHAAQTVGRQVVTEQRAARRANPPGANAPNRNAPGANQPNRGNQPQQRQNQAPGPNRQGQQQPGQPAKPGEKPGEKAGTKPGTQAPTQVKPGEKKSETKPGTAPAAQKPGEKKPETKPATPPAGPQHQGEREHPVSPPPAIRQGGTPPPVAQHPIAPRPGLQRPKPPPKEKKKKP